MKALILVADDDVDNRAIMAASLSAGGYQVCLAEDGAQAVALARQCKPDLILMDLSMPVLDGYAATRELKKDSGVCAVPVLALTAFALAGDEDKARAAGCDGYLTKPCLPADVLLRVKEALAAHERKYAPRDPLS